MFFFFLFFFSTQRSQIMTLQSLQSHHIVVVLRPLVIYLKLKNCQNLNAYCELPALGAYAHYKCKYTFFFKVKVWWMIGVLFPSCSFSCRAHVFVYMYMTTNTLPLQSLHRRPNFDAQHAHTHTHTHTYMYVHTCTCTCIYMYTAIHSTHAHVCTHCHTRGIDLALKRA